MTTREDVKVKPEQKTAGSIFPPAIAQVLRMFETRSIFDRLGPLSAGIETLEAEIVESRGVISAAEMALEGIEARIIVAGVEGKNETERKAQLLIACQADALYMRAVSEIDQHRTRIGLAQASADRLKREYRALTLEIEARNASKLLVAGVVGAAGA